MSVKFISDTHFLQMTSYSENECTVVYTSEEEHNTLFKKMKTMFFLLLWQQKENN